MEVHEIHNALRHTIKFYNGSTGKIGSYRFNRLPLMSEKELDFLSYIYNNDHLRPTMYRQKKTDSFLPLQSLVIPKSYDYYKDLFKTKQLYSEYKNRLIKKEVLVEISTGFILNHKMFPFNDRNTMNYLKKIISLPLPPIK